MPGSFLLGSFGRNYKSPDLRSRATRQLSPRIGFAWQPLGTTGKFVVRGGYGLFYNIIMGNAFEIEINNNPPSAAPLTYVGSQNALATLAAPYNPLPSLGFNGFLRTPTTNLTQSGLDPNITTPYVESYNLNVQYEVKPSWVIQLGYAGSHGVHIETGRGLNEAVLATAAAPVNCGGPSGCITTNTARTRACAHRFWAYGPAASPLPETGAIPSTVRFRQA